MIIIVILGYTDKKQLSYALIADHLGLNQKTVRLCVKRLQEQTILKRYYVFGEANYFSLKSLIELIQEYAKSYQPPGMKTTKGVPEYFQNPRGIPTTYKEQNNKYKKRDKFIHRTKKSY